MTSRMKLKLGHDAMIETLADVNDDIMEKYLEGEEISVPELKAAIRQATLNIDLFPCFSWFCLQG